MRPMMTMIAIFVFTATCTEGHDIYTGLKDHRGKLDCCNETDCRAANYRVTAAGVEMFIDNEWVRVPNEIIQYRTLHGDTGETPGGRMPCATSAANIPGPYWTFSRPSRLPGVYLPPFFGVWVRGIPKACDTRSSLTRT